MQEQGRDPIRTRHRTFRHIMLLGLSGLGLLTFSMAIEATGINPKRLPRIEASTFEVVAAKPTKDPLHYARPLPLDRLPYQQRMDKYYSIGTAFALGNNHYVTAGHVLLKGMNSLWGPPELRDGNGHVYPIDRIEKFSLARDFAEFSLEHPPGSEGLVPDTHPALNQAVYSVGNALGTGIVIRSGLYTSNTPEQQDGRWKWMRFSAAASPGNSGGPLLNQAGRVIGLVLAKSPNENLNYALPIREVLQAPQRAVIDKIRPIGFSVFSDTVDNVFKGQFSLPLSLPAFYAKLGHMQNAFDDAQLERLLTRNPDQVFPRGKGSIRMLYGSGKATQRLPAIASRRDDGTWMPVARHEVQTDLDHNARLQIAHAAQSLVFHLRKPDNLSVQQLHDDPKRLMDLILKPGFFTHNIASEKIAVTSLGEPTLQIRHTDRWDRTWQIIEWNMPKTNHRMFLLTMPVPDGYAGVLVFGAASAEHDYIAELKAMSDFVCLHMGGTLSDWRAYLSDPELVSPALSHIHIHADYGKTLSYRSDRLRFVVPDRLLAITPHTSFNLGFGFSRSHGVVKWDVKQIRVFKALGSHDGFGLDWHQVPLRALGDDYRNDWNRQLHRRPPFDGVAHPGNNDTTQIAGVIGASAASHPSSLYAVLYGLEGKHPQSVMRTKLNILIHAVHTVGNPNEHTAQR